MRRRWDVSAAEPNLPRKSSTCNNAQRRRSRGLVDLPPDLLAEIHCRLGFVDRLNLAMVLDGRLLSTEAPCLVLPGDTAETARLFSLADREAGLIAPVPDPAMRDHVVLGSSGGVRGGWPRLLTVSRTPSTTMAGSTP
ncbi:hypothetical protein PR202_ga30305 [Eleusine coracana subsp. coracana]|uniref:Uncharacterized protein n=1 Tax=Eleusine coracana subsp. coracana TaxID=191504 RepID=A0AAV5DNI4_ELECO|nr:hypothetical protein PR202_ga30305 [Eleusine coracana subsp. coracana]